MDCCQLCELRKPKARTANVRSSAWRGRRAANARGGAGQGGREGMGRGGARALGAAVPAGRRWAGAGASSWAVGRSGGRRRRAGESAPRRPRTGATGIVLGRTRILLNARGWRRRRQSQSRYAGSLGWEEAGVRLWFRWAPDRRPLVILGVRVLVFHGLG
jgi:hypothetical protein